MDPDDNKSYSWEELRSRGVWKFWVGNLGILEEIWRNSVDLFLGWVDFLGFAKRLF